MFFCSLMIYAQNVEKTIILNFNEIKDTNIKEEISLICKSYLPFKENSSKEANSLVKIPLKSCNGNSVILEKGNFFSCDKSILIETTSFDSSKLFLLGKDNEKMLLTKKDSNSYWGVGGIIPSMELKRVVCFFNEYKYIYLPIEGIYEPQLCLFTLDKKRKKQFVSNCKAYISKDRRRIYIYMLNGTEGYKYEVIWVIKDYKYYGSIITKLPTQ